MQKILKLSVRRNPSEQAWEHPSNQVTLRKFSRGEHQPRRQKSADELFADILKRQAREIMQCVGECAPGSIPAHMARLRDITEQIRFAMNHGLVPDVECGRSDKQLLYAVTLADLLECLNLTKQNHRAPECVAASALTGALAEINRKLDMIGGAIARDPALQAALFGEESEVA